MSYELLIPSAILVPEPLRDVGALPAVVYPFGEGVVLDSILEAYPDRGEVLIVACEGAPEVERRVAAMGDPAVRVAVMPEVGDLCDTVRFGLERMGGGPVVVNFSDTVAHGTLAATPDSLYASEERYGDEWTYFEDDGGTMHVTHDRSRDAEGAPGSGEAFVGVFRIDDPAVFLVAVGETSGDPGPTSHFYRALERYSASRPMTALRPDDWLDIGHRSGYVGAQLQVRAREFNHISIDRDRAILRKSSDDVDKFLGEVRWYLKLPADVSYAAPRIFSYSLSYDDPWVRMEYYPYHTLHSLWLDGRLDRAQWARVFERIAFVLDDFARYRVHDSPEVVSAALEDMYLAKTVERLERLRGVPAFEPMLAGPVVVNGTAYPGIDELEGLLAREIPSRLCSPDAEVCLMHGDLCFTNVMVDDSLSFVKLVDPRGRFGPWDVYGDRRYELAKLAHSVDGRYDLIIKDRFACSWEGASVELSVADPEGPDLYAVMREVLAPQIGGALPEVELIEALLFLSMVPLHDESLHHQVAMLATGYRLLDRSIGIRKE